MRYLFLLLLSGRLLAQAPANLRCDYRVDPLGVSSAQPMLSWELTNDRRDVLQKAYRIRVAESPEDLKRGRNLVWDSGKVRSDASIQVAYAGKPLEATRKYYWKVCVWDNRKGRPDWSRTASWQTGLLQRADWKGASWIAYEKLADSLVAALPPEGKKDKVQGGNILPLIRKEFSVKKPVRSATLFIAGPGHFDASLDGQRIGDHFLDAGWTKYDKEAQYVTFDLTDRLKEGNHALGVMLGNGFYYVPPVKNRYRKLKSMFGYPKLIARLQVRYADGTSEDMVTDASWQTAPGPVTFSSIYGGEDYDARLEQPGWDQAGFRGQGWKPALVVDGPPSLIPQTQEPLKVFETFSPKKKQQHAKGDWVYDFGQNASAIIRLRVRGKAGDTLRLYPGELLKEDGTADQQASGGPSYFQYILRGDGEETWQPQFTYYGFRYVQVKGGIPAGEANPAHRPEILELTSLHVRNAAPAIGDFTCSNDLFNRTHTLIDWAIRSNMASVFTDCPHREKLGWLEELHLMGGSVRYRYDIATLLRKAVRDMQQSQLPNGLVPEISPEYVQFDWGGGIFRDSPEWGSSAIIVPWYLYQWFGDGDVLRESYPMMQRYVAYLGTKADGHILRQGLGDWYDLGPKAPGVSQLTPMGVTGTAIYYYDLNILEKVAAFLGKDADAEQYRNLAASVKKAFNTTFFHADTKQYATNSQTANAMALFMKLADPQDEKAIVDHIVQDIRSRNNSLTAGDIGYRYLLRALEDAGRSDVIYDMNSRSDVPGYGYQLAQGATALTESWQALAASSNNHFMLGHLMEWLYAGLVGIKQTEASVAFRNTVIYPQPVGDVTFAGASYGSPYGHIRCEWRREGSAFSLQVRIPPNTRAMVYLPMKPGRHITESGRAVQPEAVENDRARIVVGSGEYHFRVE